MTLESKAGLWNHEGATFYILAISYLITTSNSFPNKNPRDGKSKIATIDSELIRFWIVSTVPFFNTLFFPQERGLAREGHRVLNAMLPEGLPTVWSQGTAPLLVFPPPNAQTLGTSVREPRQVFLMLSRNLTISWVRKTNHQNQFNRWKHDGWALASG